MFRCIAAINLFLDAERGHRILINDAIKQLTTNAQFYFLVCGLLAPGKLLPCPKEAVTDPLPKYLLFGWWCFNCYQAVADSTTVNDSNKIWYVLIFVELSDVMVYMDTVVNSNEI